MKRFSICALLLGAALAAPQAARAFDIDLAGRKLSIEPPLGYCALEQANPRDKNFLDRLSVALGEGHLLLMMFADCEELKEFRARKIEAFRRFGQILANRDIAANNKGAPLAALAGVSRNDYTAQVVQAFPRLIEAKDRDAAFNRLQQDVAERKPIGQRLLGVIERDGAGAYIAQMVEVEAAGQRTLMAGVITATLVRELRLSINLYRRYEDGNSLTALLGEQKKIAAALITRNGETVEAPPPLPPPGDTVAGTGQGGPGQSGTGQTGTSTAAAPPSEPFNWGLLIMGLALLIGIGAGLALTLWRQKTGGKKTGTSNTAGRR